jgi:glycogen phosphorylase
MHTAEPALPDDGDQSDADELYNLLENTIVPLYYDRDQKGVPHGWTHTIKESIRTCSPAFSARRMLKDYIEQMYVPAMAAGSKNITVTPVKQSAIVPVS